MSAGECFSCPLSCIVGHGSSPHPDSSTLTDSCISSFCLRQACSFSSALRSSHLSCCPMLVAPQTQPAAGFELCQPRLIKVMERCSSLRDVAPDYTYYGIASPWVQVGRRDPGLINKMIDFCPMMILDNG